MTVDDADPPPLADADRPRTLYWRELVQLTVDCEYTKRYRDGLSQTLSWFAVGRAVVSVTALSSWVGGLGYAKLWGGVIVASQLAEAVQNALPFAARERGLRAFGISLDSLLIESLLEWEAIQGDEITPEDIVRRWGALMRLRHEAETKSLPLGLPFKRRLFALAEQAAASHLELQYSTRRIS